MHNYAFSFKFKRNSRDRIISIITRAKGSWWRRRKGILSWVVIGFKEQEDRCRISQGWRDSPVHSMLLTVCDEREFYDHINHRVHGVTLSQFWGQTTYRKSSWWQLIIHISLFAPKQNYFFPLAEMWASQKLCPSPKRKEAFDGFWWTVVFSSLHLKKYKVWVGG